MNYFNPNTTSYENLNLTDKLFASLNCEGILYCHWKSNVLSDWDTLKFKDTEYDLAVCPSSVSRFIEIIYSLGFKSITEPIHARSPSLAHYLSYDDRTSSFIHLHIYYQIQTGGELVKPYRLPVIEEIVKDCSEFRNIKVINPTTDLLLFILRKTLEHRSLLETLLLLRSRNEIQKEFSILLGDEPEKSLEGVLALSKSLFPFVPPGLVKSAANELFKGVGRFRLFCLAIKLDFSLRNFRTISLLSEFVLRQKRFLSRIMNRYIFRKKTKFNLWPQGRIIAIVGPDATGKSTIVKELSDWLSAYFNCPMVHCGKPPSNLITLFLNIAAKILKSIKITKNHLPTTVFMDASRGANLSISKILLMSVRALGSAYDRSILINKIFKLSSRGHLIICDRFPSRTSGNMDSSILNQNTLGKYYHYRLFRLLSSIEQYIYKKLPSPDLVFKLAVPLEIAKSRNSARNKEKHEREDWLDFRHAQSRTLDFPGTTILEIDTNKSPEETLNEIKKHLWSFI